MADEQGAGPEGAAAKPASQAPVDEEKETDDFGLPIRRFKPNVNQPHATSPTTTAEPEPAASQASSSPQNADGNDASDHDSNSDSDSDSGSGSDGTAFVDAEPVVANDTTPASPSEPAITTAAKSAAVESIPEYSKDSEKPSASASHTSKAEEDKLNGGFADAVGRPAMDKEIVDEFVVSGRGTTNQHKAIHKRDASAVSATSVGSVGNAGLSEFSHLKLSTQQEEEKEEEDGGWQTMPAFAPYDVYDDDNRLIAKEHNEEDQQIEQYGYGGLGGAGRGYTRVIMDDDAQSATSLDENTKYLFREKMGTDLVDDEARDAVAQMQATKDLLTEGQRIAYVGVARLLIAKLVKQSEQLGGSKKTKKEVTMSVEAAKMWGQKMMIRLYSHMDISEAEQLMIEQLAEHGVMPKDLTPALHANSRVHNPMAEDRTSADGTSLPTSPSSSKSSGRDEKPAEMPPPYENVDQNDVPDVQTPAQLPSTEKIDIDLRWTVLCDLFLLLIADSVYDARSRLLLEQVAESLEISWIDICRFEKRITDALEMQQAAEKENWNEDEHMESRRKLAQRRRYMMMGLATVGGGLVIGLSAGLLAPVIGAGLAAGFTTIGVSGTSSFLAGAGGAAIITSSAAASGSIIGGRAANRRTGSVRTFEYRPLHNNKRVNLIVTVSGWLTGKVDDVRLPFSTVDPIMGDIYSVLWEPEMLRSTGDTINILATEALTQGLQQILGSTILVSLMAALQLPVVLTKLSYLIDNPWAVSLDRATAAGLILADSLLDRSLGTRPITLVGYSIGARVVFSCLQELSKRGAYGLVQNVYLFGSPCVVKTDEFVRARTVVSGRFVNGYNRNDWILGYLFRLTNGGIRRVAGLAPVEVPWVENMDVTEEVAGHMQYRTAMPILLKKCGWVVESDEFSEIEDPDPENHDQRQRELINEIEEARKELEREGKKKSGGGFSLFGRRKKAERQEWEVYEDSTVKDAKGIGGGNGKLEDKLGNNHGVLFDVDAIRAELAKESYGDADAEMALQIKEIKSTLPPMKLDLSPVTSTGANERGCLRETQSTEGLTSGVGVGDERRGSSNNIINNNINNNNNSHDHEYRDPVVHPRGDVGKEEISMTFDTSFDENVNHTTDRATVHDSTTAAVRPEMRTARTLPTMTLADPWADADEEDFGREKEISMTFA